VCPSDTGVLTQQWQRPTLTRLHSRPTTRGAATVATVGAGTASAQQGGLDYGLDYVHNPIGIADEHPPTNPLAVLNAPFWWYLYDKDGTDPAFR